MLVGHYSLSYSCTCHQIDDDDGDDDDDDDCGTKNN